jgi:hypothetical protein
MFKHGEISIAIYVSAEGGMGQLKEMVMLGR